MTVMLWTKDFEDTQARVLFTSDELLGEARRSLKSEGYEEQDSDLAFGGVMVGLVFAKFTPWNIAYDFVILSVVPDLELE